MKEPDILTNTVVQLVVNADGKPISAALISSSGLQEADKYALENAEANAKVPGNGIAEWGPADMAISLGVRSANPLPPALQAARARVFAATKANHLFFLNSVNADNVVDMIKEGVMIGSASERAAEIGRQRLASRTPTAST